MKEKNNSKKNFRHSEIEKNDIGSQKGKAVKKDKSSKRRISIYDEFEDEQLNSDFNIENNEMYYDD